MIRVLLVDDEKILREAVRAYLERKGEFSVYAVESAIVALEKLKTETWDAIVSDYRMPDMDGLTFLKTVRSTDRDTPFILMTGQGDETVASEALNSGATYYLKKDGKVKTRFAELPEKLTTAVNQRRDKDAAFRATGTLKKQTRTLLILNEIITAANRAPDITGLFRDVLEKTLILLDFDAGGIYIADMDTGTAEILHSRNLSDEFLADTRTVPVNVPPYDTLFLRKEPIITDHYEQVSPERSAKFGFLSLASVPLVSRSRVVGALNVVSKRRTEISEQERVNLLSIGLELGSAIERMTAEEEVKTAAMNFSTLFNSIDEMIFVLDMQGRILKVNETVEKRLKYTSEELIGRDVLELHVPERQDEALCNVQGMIAGTIDSCPVPLRVKDGTRIEAETKVTRGFWNGSEVLIGVTRDITERTRAEDALRTSKDQLRLLLDSTAEAIYGLDLSGCCTFCNPACLRLLGYKYPGELIGKNMHRLIHHTHSDGSPFPVEECRIFMAFRLGKGTHVDDEVLWRVDGTSFPAEYWSFPQFHEGTVVGAVVTFVDITERKTAEDALRQSEERFRQMFELHAAAMLLINPGTGAIIDANSAASRFYGYSRDQFQGMKITTINQLPQVEIQADYTGAALQANNEFIFPHRLASGEIRTVEVHSTPITIQEKTVLFSIIHDITERTRAEAAQQQLEKMLRLILTLSTRFINVDPGNIDAEISACLAEIGSFAGADRSYVFLLSGDGTRMSNSHEWCAKGIVPQKNTLQNLPTAMFPWWMKKLYRFETIHIPSLSDLEAEASAEREILQAQDIRSVLVVPLVIQNSLIGFLGFDNVRKERVWEDQIISLLEVTGKIIANAKARKRAYSALKSSEEQLALAIEGSGVGLWDWQVQTGEVIFNEKWADLVGYTLAELAPVSIATWTQLGHPDDLKHSEELLEKHFLGETREYECEARMHHKNGQWIWVLDRGKVVERDGEGKPIRMTGTHLDITARKRAERELEHRTALLTNLLDSIPDIVFFKDTNGVYLGCNPKFEEYVGRAHEEIVGHTDYDLVPKEVADFFRENDRITLGQDSPRHNEEQITYPDGHRATIDTFKAPLRTLDGRVVGILGISRDITERKKAEQAVFEANKKLNILNSITRHDVLNQITALGLMLMILKDTVLDEKTLDFVNKAQETTDRITTQIEFTKEYQDIGVLAPQWQNVQARITEAKNQLTTCPFAVEITTGTIEVYADPLLGKVFYNLLENAVRHGENVSRICFSAQESDNRLIIIYDDDGVGIDPASRKNLFRRGFGKHTGFGLYMMREILAITGITIEETGVAGGGARFEMVVPNGEYRIGNT